MEHWESKGFNFFLHESLYPGCLNCDQLYMNGASTEVGEMSHCCFFSAADTCSTVTEKSIVWLGDEKKVALVALRYKGVPVLCSEDVFTSVSTQISNQFLKKISHVPAVPIFWLTLQSTQIVFSDKGSQRYSRSPPNVTQWARMPGENFVPPHLTLLLHKQRHPVQPFSLPRSSAALVHPINIDMTWNPHFKLGWPISWKDADSPILGPHVSEADKPNYWTECFLKSALWT